MPGNRLRPLVVYALVLAVVALLGARWLQRERATSGPPAATAAGIEVQTQVRDRATVHVAGEVRRPGVYRLRAGARVHEAVSRAGGPTSRADTAQINLAAKVEDGRQVLVPARVAAVGGAAGGTSATTPPAGVPINLNTATLEQLDALDGIGPQTAAEILEYRDANDGFGSVEELGEVPGIGDKRLETLREQVRV